MSYVVESHEFRVKKTKWCKLGRATIFVQDSDKLQIGFPLNFQGQVATVTKICGQEVTVDRPIKLRNDNFTATQKVATANPKCMHQKILDTWNTHWKREDFLSNDGLWENLESYLDFIPRMAQLDKCLFHGINGVSTAKVLTSKQHVVAADTQSKK